MKASDTFSNGRMTHVALRASAAAGCLLCAWVLVTACASRPIASQNGAESHAVENCSRAPSAGEFSFDDTTRIMLALGGQLRRDYRCFDLQFASDWMCATGAVYRCRSAPTPRAIRPMIAVASDAAGGVACVAAQCAGNSAAVHIMLEEPTIVGDTASILVEVQYPSETRATTVHFERNRYVLVRPSARIPVWLVHARFFESSGTLRVR